MKLKELQQKLLEIKEMGFIPSMRKGSTGIGYTFERLLGIEENNLPIPDIGGRVEIKTIRRDSQSLITLFTFNRGVWLLPQKEVVRKYGYKDKKGRFALKNTIFYGKPIPQGISIEVDDTKNIINLVDTKTNEIIATWDIYVIVGKFMTKLGRLLLIIAERKTMDRKEFFKYDEAYLLTEPSSRRFLNAFRTSLIGIDIRMHLKESGAVRNRGTGFRIKEKDLVELYEERKKLL